MMITPKQYSLTIKSNPKNGRVREVIHDFVQVGPAGLEPATVGL